MKKDRLLELAGVQLDEDFRILPQKEWNQLTSLTAKALSKLMQERYPNIDPSHKDFDSKANLVLKELNNMVWDEVGDHLTNFMEKQ